jgi:hypothetical protein
VHTDGTIYAVIYRIVTEVPCGSSTAALALQDVIVYRSEPGETGSFESLTDSPVAGSPGDCNSRDGGAGYRLVRCAKVANDPYMVYGQERRDRTHVAIAVDPQDSGHLFVAWGGSDDPSDTNLYLTESRTRGSDSLEVDMVQHAINPALAVTSDGQVGFAYQRLEGGSSGRWITEIRVYADGHPHVLKRVVELASTVATDPRRCSIAPYIGDYMHLVSVGKSFYGVFSAAGYQDQANFPSGLDPGRTPSPLKKLSCNDDPTKLEVSIDPYFYALERRSVASILASPKYSVAAKMAKYFSKAPKP